MKRIGFFVCIGICILAALLVSKPKKNVVYEVIDLGVLFGDGINSSARGINQHGQVVGNFWNTGESNYQPFLYENGKLTYLSTPPDSTQTWVLDINKKGQIVGYYSKMNGTTEVSIALLYDKGGMTELDIPQVTSWGDAINDRGQIAIRCGLPSPAYSYLYEKGVPTLLPGFDTQAYDINNRGQLVGASEYCELPSCSQQAYLYEKGKLKFLGALIPGVYPSYALGINNRGQIVGWSYTTTGGMNHAFLYEKGKMKDLGVPDDYLESRATAINDHRQIVGFLGDESFSLIHAFVYENGTMNVLPFPAGAQNSSASANNNKGQIVGYVEFSDSVRHAALWNPIKSK